MLINSILAVLAVNLFSYADAHVAKPNVILITFDGVRRAEFFNKAAMPTFWKKYGPEGLSVEAKIANRHAISMPGYQNITTGAVQPCGSNECGRVRVETIFEELLRKGFQRTEVAAVTSWEKLPWAIESHPGAIVHNCGFAKPSEAAFGPMASKIGEMQDSDRPHWEENRWDKYTWALGMAYLRKNHPRFLWISLNDTDDWAHQGNYPGYLKALNQYDVWLDSFFIELRAMGEYGENTTVILTTDHGRGSKDPSSSNDWRDHSSSIAGSDDIWMYMNGPKVKQTGFIKPLKTLTHSDLRPLIENFLEAR